ncbi:7231_t:CDS:2 [Dentiscutata heterogama]|uniref:7231_t:CDS:1 n=1 Tax=Dentiscutata heterogama TaxID=1316150 RepID=A0ACA9JWT6_9GLOM|nr:7231_t:CDS:2 [Dentiscutata heterogama]
MKDQLSHNDKKRKTGPSVDINNTSQLTSRISTSSSSNKTEKSTINLDQPLDVGTPDTVNNMDVTSPSRIPFTTLQYQMLTMKSKTKIRASSIETTRVIRTGDNAIPNKGRSSKVSSKGKNNGMI